MNASLPLPPPAKVPLPRYQDKGPITGRVIRHGIIKPHIFCVNGKWHCQSRVSCSSFKGHTAPVYAYRQWERSLRWNMRAERG